MSDNISPRDVATLIHRDISPINNNVKTTNKRKTPQLSPNSVNINREKERERGKKRRLEQKNKPTTNQIHINQPIFNIIFENNIRNIDSLTVIQLKKLLKEKKLNTVWPKAELLERLAQVRIFKYATKSEKAGASLNDLYKSVIKFSDDNDNSITKIKSLMLKTVAGKRDIGQCEVCRLLNSEPLYSSTFKYVTQSLELTQSKELNEISTSNQNNKATNKSLLDFYVQRENNPKLIHMLDEIKSFNSLKLKRTHWEQAINNPKRELSN